MYAQIFGMAKEVAKQFKNLYPEIVQNMEEAGIDYTNVVLMNTISLHEGSAQRLPKEDSYPLTDSGPSL